MKAFLTNLLNVGIVHEWFACYAGSERVVEQMLEVFPQAELYSLVDFLPELERAGFRGRKIVTSFLQRMPFARRHFRAYLPLMPIAIEQLDVSLHDVVITSNHAVAKGVLTRPDQLHICYAHTPIRYAWDLQHQYLREAGLSRGVRSAFVRLLLHYLRNWDCVSSARVDVFVANSNYIARRIRKAYNRDAQVIYPPVDVDAFPLHRRKESFYVAASRLVPYKKMDVVVDAFRRMPDRQLVVIGDGPMFKRLAAGAPANVQMLGHQPHERLKHFLQRAKAFVFAAEEDFGILPVEAQACGTPVVAFGRGGALETILDGITGRFFYQQHYDSVVAAVQAFEAESHEYDSESIRNHAERFRPERFRQEFTALVHREWESFHEAHRLRMESTRHALSRLPRPMSRLPSSENNSHPIAVTEALL
jgi:glycosyltransferase involved in cell wall biosynthesis